MGYWSTGLIQREEPRRGPQHLGAYVARDLRQRVNHLDVALQVAFERQTLKPAFHLIGYRLWF
jgi:hypothetical protein